MQYAMVIDLVGCIGCQTCAVACKMAHNLPKDIWRCDVKTEGGDSFDTPAGHFPENTMQWRPTTCNHCENPACVAVCPAGATYKDENTGIVVQDTSLCIGCQSCIRACPYEGVRTYLTDEPRYPIDFALGYEDEPAHIVNTVEKCTFCYERVRNGEEPACMRLCIGRSRFWGDIEDSQSEVSQLLANRRYEQMNTEAGTGPYVYYLL
jgi:molybdopterin-containing oxidoreductase family iron-sulfur binding subunit